MDMHTKQPTVEERVARGMALLDATWRPDWWQEGLIDLGKLDLQAPCRCVLGQLAIDRYANDHSWSWILSEFGLSPQYRDHMQRGGRETDWECGFNANTGPSISLTVRHREYVALTAEWKRAILARRAAA
jgi:hypothetical protein